MGGNPFTGERGAAGRCDICQRCLVTGSEDGEVLSEIAGSGQRKFESMLRHLNDNMPSLRQKASKWAEKRLEEERERLLDNAQTQRDDIRERMEQQISELGYQAEEEVTGQDLEECLAEYVRQGQLEWENEEVRITSKGAEKLANNALKRVLARLAARGIGSHSLQEVSYGSQLAISSRKYELGDEYHNIDFDKTFLNALERDWKHRNISLELEDFLIYDELYETRMCAGLIIDDSGSMLGDKMRAALETAMALAELIRREPGDLLKVFLFSSYVREIPYYEIPNANISGGTTDIVAALRAFRKATLNEKGEKQAYLITDTEPNTVNGRVVGFSEAASAVVQEALQYRQRGITLNIIMLGQSPGLKELASILAKKNQGRVFFASPEKLGEIVIEDYLLSRKKSLSGV